MSLDADRRTAPDPTTVEFILLVAKMRDAQKRYLKEPSQAALLLSKILERKVDLALQRDADPAAPPW